MALKIKQYSLSLKVWLFIVVALCATFFFYQKNYPHREVIVSDGYAYYAFLPAAFIYHDLTFKYVDNLPGNLYVKYWLTTYPGENYRITKMTIGTPLLMLPFFLAGHAYAVIFHYDLTGYSRPYQDMVAFSALFYCIMGLYFVRKSLLKFFSEPVASVALVILIAATNLLNYTLNEASMSHVYSFFGISLFVWFTVRWHESYSSKHFLLLCFSLALVTLVRQFNLVGCLFPLLYGINNREILLRKTAFIRKRWKLMIVGFLVFFIVLSPQLLLWKYQTGKWFFDSYQNEHFFFNQPHIIDVLFGFRNGWLIYTPVMITSVIGMWFAMKQRKAFAIPLIVFFPVVMFILSCWWCWNYGGAFGFRPLVDFYPLLILPACAFISEFISTKNGKVFFSILFLFFISLNIFQQMQYQRGILHYSDMTARSYAAIFGKSYFPGGYEKLLDPFDHEMAYEGKPLRNMRKFEDFGFRVQREETVNIKAYNQKYFSVDRDLNLLLVANNDSAKLWETFTLIHLDSNRCALKAWNGCYLLTLDWGEQKAQMNLISKKEVFDYIDLGKNTFALKAVNGKYLSVELTEPFYVYAASPVIGERTIFTLEK